MATVPPPRADDGGAWTVVIAAASFGLNFIISLIAGAWALVRSGRAADDKIELKDRAVTQEFTAMERRLKSDIDTAKREFGETVHALRQGLTEAQFWNRDNFVSKQTFNSVVGDMRQDVRDLGDRIDGRFDRLEDRFDEKERKS